MEAQPKKVHLRCAFHIAPGLHVGDRGIEAKPAKVDAIHKMAKPSNKKEVKKLTGMMAALGRFISKLGEKAYPSSSY
jgi:hypothetical protein